MNLHVLNPQPWSVYLRQQCMTTMCPQSAWFVLGWNSHGERSATSLAGVISNGIAPSLTSCEKPKFVWFRLRFATAPSPTMEKFTAGLYAQDSRKEALTHASTTVEDRCHVSIMGASILQEWCLGATNVHGRTNMASMPTCSKSLPG